MLRNVLAHLRSQWAGFLALFLVIAGGTAYAANTVFSSDIVDGEVKTADLANNSVHSTKIATGQVQSADLATESVGTAEVGQASISYGDLAPSARGARASAWVAGSDLDCDVGDDCPLLRNSGRVAYARQVATGKFCVRVTGIPATDPTAIAIVRPSDEVDIRWARWNTPGNDSQNCAPSEWDIETGTGSSTGVGDYQSLRFTFVIP